MTDTQVDSKTLKKFQYKDGETVTQYIRRINGYKADMAKEKYNIILEFINELIGFTRSDKYRLRSLTDFKRIKEDDILKNYAHNIKTINKYRTQFNKTLGIKIDKVDINDGTTPKDKDEAARSTLSEESQPEPEDSRYVISIIRRILAPIQYKLTSKRHSSGKYYWIKC